ncbi:hypothetical protein NM208_g16369 [Fusarium decemcellulare]|uniref:Uncharacterized protein n=1 Tax=Fusarium decemcellulare TaxID=57161 RepID=A0ACC1RAC8_9HYPO|nr:hypothetical protein NM208_g16369 [Fusarium decemcellulare]
MRDDERYPTVVPPDTTTPEVAPGSYVDPYGHDKALDDRQDPGMIPTYDESQKEVVGGNAVKDETAIAGAGIVGTRGGAATESIEKGPRRIFGLRRRMFLIVLAAVMFVLIGGVVGGTVGGIKANEDDNNGGGDDNGGGGGNGDGDIGGDGSGDDSSATATDTGPVPRKTGPIDADERLLGAVVASDDDDENIQIFYNDLNTTNILYRRVHDDSGGAEHTLDLEITPNWGTPLAATVRLASSVITTQLFYVTTRNNETQIAEVTLNCGNINADDDDNGDDGDDDDDDDGDDDAGSGNANTGTAACGVGSNTIISSNLTSGVHAESKLAALRLSNDSVRVYFQANRTNIWALNNDNAAEGWSGSNLMGDVRAGTSIAATRSNATDIHVFFVGNETRWMRTFSYSDTDSPGTSQVVDDEPDSSWGITVPFDATYVPASNTFNVFYANSSSGTIVSYSRSGSQTAWSKNSNNPGGTPASGITAIGWEDHLRIFYYQNGQLTTSTNDGESWETPESVTSGA